MIDTKPTEAWSYVAVEVNRLAEEIDSLKEMLLTLETRIPKKRTKEELAEIRRENLRKAREARAKAKNN